jgi:hypothetical protein
LRSRDPDILPWIPPAARDTRWDGPAHRVLLAAGYTPTILDRFDSAEGVANVLYTSPPSRIIDPRPSDRA